MGKYLITGVAGFIGSHTVANFLVNGHQVLGVDSLRTGKIDNLKSSLQDANFRFEQIDILNRSLLQATVTAYKPEAIIHLAALVSVVESVENPDLNISINVNGTQNVAEVARQSNVARLVFASSAAVYGEPQSIPISEDSTLKPENPYGAAKLEGESILLNYGRRYGMQTRCLRYFNVYGPRQNPDSPYSGVISIFLRQAKSGEAVTVYGDGSQTRDFIFVEDVARANRIAAEKESCPCGSYNICTGREHSILNLIDSIKMEYGELPQPGFSHPRPGETMRSCGQPDKAAKFLNFKAETTLAKGLHKTIIDSS